MLRVTLIFGVAIWGLHYHPKGMWSYVIWPFHNLLGTCLHLKEKFPWQYARHIYIYTFYVAGKHDFGTVHVEMLLSLRIMRLMVSKLNVLIYQSAHSLGRRKGAGEGQGGL